MVADDARRELGFEPEPQQVLALNLAVLKMIAYFCAWATRRQGPPRSFASLRKCLPGLRRLPSPPLPGSDVRCVSDLDLVRLTPQAPVGGRAA